MTYHPNQDIIDEQRETNRLLKEILSILQPRKKQSMLLKFKGFIKRILRRIRINKEIKKGLRCPVHKYLFEEAHDGQTYCGICYRNLKHYPELPHPYPYIKSESDFNQGPSSSCFRVPKYPTL